MKKFLCVIAVVAFFVACNPNPNATGDKIIMDKEHKENALEFQKNPIDSVPSNTPATDTSVQKDSIGK